MGKITNGWNFSRADGFSGSCGGTPVKGYMRGGHVKHSGHKLQRTAAPLKAPPATSARATVHHGATTPHRYARGGNVRPHEVEHRDYKEYNAPRDEAVYPEVSDHGRPAGYAKGGRAPMHLHLKKGALHRELGVKEGHKIPARKLEHALHSKSPLERKRAQFAENAKHWDHHKYAHGGEVTRDAVEHDEGARRGGRIMKKAHGGHVDGTQKAARAHLKAHRHETEHHRHHARPEYQNHHDHGGKAAARSGHSTPHPYAMGGLARPPNPTHRMIGRRPPMVSPLAAGAPRMPMMGAPMGGAPPMAPGMAPGLKHGGRSRK